MDNKLNKNLKTKITHQPQPKNTNILRIDYQKKIIQKKIFLPGKRLFLQIENPNLYLKKHIKLKIK